MSGCPGRTCYYRITTFSSWAICTLNRYASGAVSFDSMIGVVIPSVSKGHSEIVFMDGYRPYAEFSWFVHISEALVSGHVIPHPFPSEGLEGTYICDA